MGQLFAKLEELWNSFRRDTCILILGLDNAGKTAVLYALKLEEPMEYTVPTVGFNVEEIQLGHVNIKMWDIGGQSKIRELWPHYFEQANGIAFVVDSNDIDRLQLARNELHALIANKELVGKPFLILANKQDLPRAATKEQLIKHLGLELIHTSPWHIIDCCAIKNTTLRHGFEWLSEQI
jgi:small GTP-binding protein